MKSILFLCVAVAVFVGPHFFPAHAESLCIDYDCSVLPEQSIPGFTHKTFAGASKYASNGELHLVTSQGSPTVTGVWFGNHGSWGRPSWAVPSDADGVYMAVRARVVPGSTWWYWYINNDSYNASFQLISDSILTYSCAGDYYSGSIPIDGTEYHDFAFLLRNGEVTYWVDGEQVYQGAAYPTTNPNNLLIGDGFGTTLRGTGEMVVDHVTITHGPTDINVWPVSSTFDADLEGWVLIGEYLDRLSWQDSGGDPGGYAHFSDQIGKAGTLVAPSKYLGDWTSLDGNGHIQFSHKLIELGDNWSIGDYMVEISGPGGEAVFIPDFAPEQGEWTVIQAPLSESDWQVVRGNWADIFPYVALLKLKIEVVAGGAGDGGTLDQEGIDNVIVDSVPLTGSIEGVILADCGEGVVPLAGIQVDAYELDVGGPVANGLTDASGYFEIPNITAGDFILSMVTPLGYAATNNDLQVGVEYGQVAVADFALECVETIGEPRGGGFWKHQIGVATGGNGNAQVNAEDLCAFLDEIAGHFNSNEINQVIVYQPPESGLCEDKLLVAKSLLNLRGHQEMIARARQQLMTILLNVSAGYMALNNSASEDGATISQAITFCDQVIDDPSGDHELAKDIAETINKGRLVDAGVIPLDIVNIAYRIPGMTTQGYVLDPNQPNPFNPATKISYSIPGDEFVSLVIYSLDGRVVKTLVSESQPMGRYEVIWNGVDNSGRRVASGTYLYGLKAGGFTELKKMTLVK